MKTKKNKLTFNQKAEYYALMLSRLREKAEPKTIALELVEMPSYASTGIGLMGVFNVVNPTGKVYVKFPLPDVTKQMIDESPFNDRVFEEGILEMMIDAIRRETRRAGASIPDNTLDNDTANHFPESIKTKQEAVTAVENTFAELSNQFQQFSGDILTLCRFVLDNALGGVIPLGFTICRGCKVEADDKGYFQHTKECAVVLAYSTVRKLGTIEDKIKYGIESNPSKV